ncbi:TIGR02206 family membrane protein [Ornithinimicrobium sufpigmenti]|uniref:YwaF family protein n=1 Tax=Ornithinimicrobium sufpigmenti TaxID=2508882 RepID=UPI0010368488|nr:MULTISPECIES: TIGR02206 family membrane protein [unclassified Ornithinimicrobium]
METFLDPDPGFIPVFGRDHLVFVLGLLVVATALVAGRGWLREHATVVRRVVFGVLLVQQVALYGFYAATGWLWAESLPVHISRISTILALVYLATGSRRVMDVLFFFGLWAWASFTYPQNVQPPTNLLGVSFWVNHVATLLMPFFAVLTTRWRPTARALWRAYGWFLVYVALAVAVNALTGGNYFYQREKPLLPMVPQPWYLLLSLLAALALFWLGYAVARLVLRRLDSRG